MSIQETIKASPLFYDLYDDEIDLVLNTCQVISFGEGEFIARDGEDGKELYILLSGKAHAMKGNVVIAELKRGDLIGELVLLNEQTVTADIVSKSFSDVLCLKYESILALYSTNAHVFAQVMLNLARLLAKRLKDAGGTIKELHMELQKRKAS